MNPSQRELLNGLFVLVLSNVAKRRDRSVYRQKPRWRAVEGQAIEDVGIEIRSAVRPWHLRHHLT
jgi:hypothetical protein